MGSRYRCGYSCRCSAVDVDCAVAWVVAVPVAVAGDVATLVGVLVDVLVGVFVGVLVEVAGGFVGVGSYRSTATATTGQPSCCIDDELAELPAPHLRI